MSNTSWGLGGLSDISNAITTSTCQSLQFIELSKGTMLNLLIVLQPGAQWAQNAIQKKLQDIMFRLMSSF